MQRLRHNLHRDGILYRESDFGRSLAGRLQKLDEKYTVELPEGKLTYYYLMEVNAVHNDTEKFSTITHELGHLYLGHLGRPFGKWWPDRRYLDHQTVEFEAESVSWLVSERLGLPNKSAEYLSGYLKVNEEIPNVDLDGIFRTVNLIEAMTKRVLPRRKENFEKRKSPGARN